MAFDILLRQGILPDGTIADIGISGGWIAAIESRLESDAGQIVEAAGNLVSPPFVDPHFHMDATLSYGIPRINASGTLLEGIALWGELKPLLTHEAVKERALRYCDWAVSMGLLAIRTHVDVCDDRLLAVEALLEVKKEVAPYVDLQLVAFPQDGFYRSANAKANTLRALDLGVDVVGGIPHFERTMEDGRRSVTELCEIAAQRGLMVDMHCDETDDPLSRHVEQLAFETQRLGLAGRVVGSHLTSMHSMDNYYVSKLLPLIAESGMAAIPNPLINIVLQGRHDTYPKRRGMTRVPEMLKAGIRVGFGQDCVLDPWYSLGTADMLDVAFMGLHVAQMTSPADMRRCFDMVTTESAAIMGLEDYGLAVGKRASLVVLDAGNPIEAIRLRAERLCVIARGKLVAERPRREMTLSLLGRPPSVHRRHRI
ncbi:amidohydrolase family protein [Mesorhizobium koreense]|uniref:amidohydrolase family protein n=1 Tax=Mesorhizobium koreense TaxID=3074855 RepID=UPI00287B8B51|nr:amidohydrolase family protein [Mesorhizobium sp. WR6]